MVSCEPYHTKAYSEDMRWRVIWQTEGLGCTQSQVAKNLGVDKSTVSRVLSKFLATGSLSKKKYYKEKLPFRKITPPAQTLILTLVLEKPGIYLREIQKKKLLDELQLEVNTSTICRFLHENNFRHQKLSVVALQRDNFLRQKYIHNVSLYGMDMLIFLDETGADIRNSVRKRGYSLRGIEHQAMLVRGERTSAVAMMSTKGILDIHVTKGTTNGDTFYHFIEKCTLPHLQPFNGINPHSVLIMDNCSIHHVQEVLELIEGVGVMLHYLPPYSPDLNPSLFQSKEWNQGLGVIYEQQ